MSFFKRLALVAFVLVLGFIAFIRYISIPSEESSPVIAEQAATPPPISIESMGRGAVSPTPEELEDEQHFFDEQVQKASVDLSSPSPEERVGAVEQLAAYPTQDSEALLVQAMKGDFDPEVRLAAAQNIVSFKQPDDKTIDALLMMLEDSDKRVQLGCLNSLLSMVDHMDGRSQRVAKIVSILKKKSVSSKLKPLTRKAIQEYLNGL